MKSFPSHFDAVVIYHNDASEVNFIKDEVERYKDAPIKAFIGKEAYDRAGEFHAVAFTHGQQAELLAHLQSQYASLEVVIKQAFQSFDKDGSGFIDLNEL